MKILTVEPDRRTTPIEQGWLLRFCADRGPRPTVAFVSAHPDDAVIGAAARLPALEGRCSFVHVTDGAPHDMRDAASAGFSSREAYARARVAEVHAALARAGVTSDLCTQLEVIASEAVRHAAGIARALAALFALRPTDVVVTHPYEGGHPDHDATALAVHTAVRLAEHASGRRPVLVEMTSYHAGICGMRTGAFLPGTGDPPRTIRLSPGARLLKREMLACLETQRHMLTPFMCDVERFRLAPQYDFTRPPHDGPLYYERFDWGMDGGLWRDLAARALASLSLS
jgi:LmbE family N-acetylglucosaminyl deacetylase